MSNNERKNRKVKKSEKEEYKWPRLIVTISLIALIIAYFICLTSKNITYDSPVCIIIAIAAGVLLMTFAFVIRAQRKKVDLDYDSIVVWKLCFVAGVVIAGFGILCIFI